MLSRRGGEGQVGVVSPAELMGQKAAMGRGGAGERSPAQ